MRPRMASSPTSRMMLVSCNASPRVWAYWVVFLLRLAEDARGHFAHNARHQVAVALQVGVAVG